MAQARASNRDSGVEQSPQPVHRSAFAPANRRRLSGPGLRTFLAIADLWALAEDERRAILGFPPRSTYHTWTKAVREHRDITLDVDVLTRISAVLGIHQALQILNSVEADGIAWLRRPHRSVVFSGRAPLELITSGSQDALMTVRRFLDAARGGLYMEPNELDRSFEPYTDANIVFA